MLNVDLSSLVRSKIENEGPIPIKDFLKYVLEIQNKHFSPQYLKKQFRYNTYIFEEIIAEWCINFWQINGKPKKLNIVIFSPQNSSLISRIFEYFQKDNLSENNIKIYIIENNAHFTKLQKENLKKHLKQVTWVKKFNKIPIGSFSIVIANKFFSSLPIDQYTHKKGDWLLNMVALKPYGQYFHIEHLDTLNRNIDQFLNNKYSHVQEGGIVELHDNTIILLKKIVDKIKKFGGGVLLTDYGYTNQANRPFVSTLQAKSDKRWYSPFYNLGKHRLSTQLNFSNIRDNIELHGGKVYGPIKQKDFLDNMKIEEKKIRLLNNFPKEHHIDIISEYNTLTSNKQIGYLIKAMLICNHSHSPTGFF